MASAGQQQHAIALAHVITRVLAVKPLFVSEEGAGVIARARCNDCSKLVAIAQAMSCAAGNLSSAHCAIGLASQLLSQ